MKHQSTQSGSALVIALSAVIVLLLGAIGWLSYKNLTTKSTTRTSTNQSTQTTDKQPATTQQTALTLSVPQLGVKLVNLPAGLQDLTASPDTNSPQYINFYKKSASTTAAIASMSKVDGTYDGAGELQLAKQFSGYWISYGHPNGIISDASVSSAVGAFSSYIQDGANIQAL